MQQHDHDHRQGREQPPGRVEAQVPGGRVHEHHAPPTGGQPERHAGAHEGHSTAEFARRFWVSLVLTLPVLFYSDLLQ